MIRGEENQNLVPFNSGSLKKQLTTHRLTHPLVFSSRKWRYPLRDTTGLTRISSTSGRYSATFWSSSIWPPAGIILRPPDSCDACDKLSLDAKRLWSGEIGLLVEKETSEINLKSLQRDQQPPLACSHLSFKSLQLFISEASFLVSPGDYGEAAYSDRVESECHNLSGYPNTAKVAPPPPEMKSGYFLSGLRIGEFLLYPRRDLKVYHLPSSYTLWTNYCGGLSTGEAPIDSVYCYDVWNASGSTCSLYQ